MATNPYAMKPLNTGMAGGAPMGQKSIKPLPQQPAGMDAASFFQKYNPTTADHRGQVALSALGKMSGFSGNPMSAESQGFINDSANGWASGKYFANEGGTNYAPERTSPWTYDQGFLDSLKGYTFTPSGDTERLGYNVTSPSGQSQLINWRTKDSGFDKFAEKAIPIGLTALGGAALGGFIPGAEIGAAGGTSGAAAAGAADIGALGLSESVYGLGGAMGAGVEAGTIGGLAGSTTGLGGLGSTLPAGFGTAGGLGSAGLGLSTVGGPDPAGLVSGGFEAPAYSTAAADSALASQQLGYTGAELGAAGAPSSVNLGSLGTYATGGGIVNNIANALEAARVNPSGALASAGSSVLDFAKKNPQLAALGVSGLAQLAGGSPSLPAAPGSGSAAGGGSAGSPALISALEKQIGGMGAPDYSGVFGLKNTAGDPNTLNQQAIDAAYSQQTRMLDPQFQRDQQAMEARLAEQGFVPGTPGYQRAMEIFNQARTDAYGRARDSSILQGYQIGQGDFRNRLSDAEFNNAASREALAQVLAKRSQPFNELSSLKGLQQIDYNNALDRYNAQVQSSNSRNQALSQLALALGMYLG